MTGNENALIIFSAADVAALIKLGLTPNSLYTRLGLKLATGQLGWLAAEYPDQTLTDRERLYLHVSQLSGPPACLSCQGRTEFTGYTKGYRTTCSRSCARHAEHKERGAEILDKMRATSLAKYGVQSTLDMPERAENHRAAMKARRGLPASEAGIVKARATLQERYGVSNPGAIPAVKQRVQQTMQQRYGGYYLAVHGNKLRSKKWVAELESELRIMYNTELLEPLQESKQLAQARCLACATKFELSVANGRVSRCPVCFFKPANRSAKEGELSEFIRTLQPVVLTNAKSKELIWPQELDIWLPGRRTAIEFNGDYWHSSPRLSPNYHLEKLRACRRQGINLIQLFEHEWDGKRELIKDRLRALLGSADRSLNARDCTVVSVNAAAARALLNRNHLQGYVSGSYWGLELHGELLMLLGVGRPRFNRDHDLELLRLCTVRGSRVRGGAGKLLAHVRRIHEGSKLLSYHDLRWGSGETYSKLGFTLLGETSPGYIYVKGSAVVSRYSAQKGRLGKLLGKGYNEKLTESANMLRAGYSKLYDCGQAVYSLIL